MTNQVVKKLAAVLLIAASSMGFSSSASASLLTPAYEAQLSTWLGQGSLSFTNIYSAGTGDGNFSSFPWHSAVDGQGATFTLIEVPAGTYYGYDPLLNGIPVTIDRSIIGGYNPQSWNGALYDYNYTPADADRTAFIYNLSTSILLRQILSTAEGRYQTYNDTGFGPTFGAGHDIFAYGGLSDNYYAFPYSYGATYGTGLFGTIGGSPYQGFLNGFPWVRLETYTFSTTDTVPEPSTIALIGMALLSLFGFVMMRRRAEAHHDDNRESSHLEASVILPHKAVPTWFVRTGLIAALLTSFLTTQVAQATIIEGTFTGLVAYANGAAPGDPTDLLGLVGSSFSGSFTYDSEPLNLVSSSSISSTWYSYGSSHPVVFSVNLYGHTYTARGTTFSYLAVNYDPLGNSNPANRFHLAARSADAYMDMLVKDNNLGVPYISNLADPGTVFFAHKSFRYGSEAALIIFYDSTGQQTGLVYFGVSDSSAGPVIQPTGVPEPSAFALIGMALLSLFGLVPRRSNYTHGRLL